MQWAYALLWVYRVVERNGRRVYTWAMNDVPKVEPEPFMALDSNRVYMSIDVGGRTFVGRSADTDIVVASAKALMNALNRAIAYMPAHAREQQVLSNP